MIPRGGECGKCHKHVLWGDIVRGCYRRRTGGQGTAIEQSVIVEEAEQDEDGGEVFGGKPMAVSSPRKRKASGVKKVVSRTKLRAVPPEEEGEFFDLDAVSSSDSSSHSSRSPKKAKPSSPRPRGRPPGSTKKSKTTETAPGMLCDIDDFSLTESDWGSVRGKSPSRRRKSRSKQASDVGLIDGLASLRVQDVDAERPPPPLRKRSRDRPARPGADDTEVIEISD